MNLFLYRSFAVAIAIFWYLPMLIIAVAIGFGVFVWAAFEETTKHARFLYRLVRVEFVDIWNEARKYDADGALK